MGHIGRRIGLSQDRGDSNPNAGAVGGGILDLIANQYFESSSRSTNWNCSNWWSC